MHVNHVVFHINMHINHVVLHKNIHINHVVFHKMQTFPSEVISTSKKSNMYFNRKVAMFTGLRQGKNKFKEPIKSIISGILPQGKPVDHFTPSSTPLTQLISSFRGNFLKPFFS